MSDVLTAWARSERYAQLDGVRARPLRHHVARDTPIVVQRTQASALFLEGEHQDHWILKKFRNGRVLDRAYLTAIQAALPRHPALCSATERRLLERSDHRREGTCFYSDALAHWLEGTLLMPRVGGQDWGALADDLRDGVVVLDSPQRVALAHGLAEVVAVLEQAGCAHRDLSSSNVFIDTSRWTVALIDFESAFHARVAMPSATTCGTEGYTPPFVWAAGRPDARATWCAHADRYALALLIVEILITDQTTPVGAEGGVFDQDELRSRQGHSIRHAVEQLHRGCPLALRLFESAICARQCAECPSPDAWLRVLACLSGPAGKPSPVSVLAPTNCEDFLGVLQRRRPAVTVWPAPQLADMPCPSFQVAVPPAPPATVVPLPADPWKRGAGPRWGGHG